MPARHYQVEYTEDDVNYTLLSADEAPGPGKTQTLTGLSAGTHTGKLRLTPLTGESPVVSLPFTFQVGTIPISEPVQATVTATATIADVMTLRDNLLAAIGVTTVVDDVQAGIIVDNVVTSATGQAVQTDAQTMRENLTAASTTAATIADVKAMLESVLATATAQTTVTDTFNSGSPSVPATPTQSALTVGNAQLTANWADVSGETSYTVYYSTSSDLDADNYTYSGGAVAYPGTPDATAGKISGIAANSISQAITGLTNGTTYYVRVSASNAAGTSALSSVQSATPHTPVTVADNFNRADASTLGTNYVKPTWALSNVKIVSNQAAGSTSGSYTSVGRDTAIWNPSVNTFAADQYAECTFADAVNGGARLLVRVDSSTETYYGMRCDGLIYKVVGGGNRGVAFSNQVSALGTVTATDVVRLSVQGNAPAVLKVYKNGVLKATVTDSTSPITSGQPGIMSDSGGYSQVDSFAAGEL